MKKISILFVALLGLFVTSCEKDFETVNTDPNKPTAVPAHLLLGNLLRVNQNVIYGMGVGGDMGMCWGQHASKVQYNDEERYIPRRGTINNVWNVLYASVISDAKSMYILADSEGNDNLKGISLIMQANAFQILTDLYGPIPFSQACQPGVLKPAYDSQKDVYTGIVDLLTQADALLASGSGSIPATSDLAFGGDVTKWRKLANSLKFKALMRTSKVQNVSAQLQALVTASNMMTSNSDSAALTYLTAQPDANPIYETVVFGARAEYKMSSVFVNKLNSLTDPRLAVMASKNSSGAYVGNAPGVENSGNYPAYSSFGSFYLKPTLLGVIMSYSQSEFLLAEAANEGYISGGIAGALSHYDAAIQSNFDFNGISASAPTYIAQPTVTFASQAEARTKIGEQVWISLFGQGIEAWTEWRRTGYPALLPVANAATATIPSRFYYPDTEVSLNKANYEAASASLTGGDKLTSRLWWMN